MSKLSFHFHLLTEQAFTYTSDIRKKSSISVRILIFIRSCPGNVRFGHAATLTELSKLPCLAKPCLALTYFSIPCALCPVCTQKTHRYKSFIIYSANNLTKGILATNKYIYISTFSFKVSLVGRTHSIDIFITNTKFASKYMKNYVIFIHTNG